MHTSLAYYLASLVGTGIAVLLVILTYRPSRKHWLSVSCMALALANGLSLARYLFLETNYVLLWMGIFGSLAGALGMAVGRVLENRLGLIAND